MNVGVLIAELLIVVLAYSPPVYLHPHYLVAFEIFGAC